MKKYTIGIVSGFMDPLGIQHLSLINAAKEMCDYLIVGVNSDDCCRQKKKQESFMPIFDRKIICQNLKSVDEVVEFDDTDGTACELIKDIYLRFKNQIDSDSYQILFMNGGDRNFATSPEEKYVEEKLKGKITMVYGCGGDTKISSSSDYLKNWVNNTMLKYNIDFKLIDKY